MSCQRFLLVLSSAFHLPRPLPLSRGFGELSKRRLYRHSPLPDTLQLPPTQLTATLRPQGFPKGELSLEVIQRNFDQMFSVREQAKPHVHRRRADSSEKEKGLS